MKKLFFYLLVLCSIVIHTSAQITAPTARHKMAIFTPLHLDEAFDGSGRYLFSGNSFPKNTIPGLEFYHGASIAVDSLNALNLPLDVYIYDTKSASETIEQQFSKCAADGVELIIASSSIGELAKLAALAADKKIMFINALVPNDGNTTNNPYFVLLNPTLQTQVEGVYQYIKNNFSGQEVVFFTKSGATENYIKSAFENANKNHSMPVKYISMNDSISMQQMSNAFVNAKPAVSIIGSLDAYFAGGILKNLALLSKNYSQTTAIGMPTMENIGLAKSEYKGVEIVYGTPFYNPRTDVASKNILAYYNKKMFSRPSDLVFRAYAVTYHFGRLLSIYGKELNRNLNNKAFYTFYNYDIKPVPDNQRIDYFENKKLYFLKYLNGALKQVN